MTFPCLLFQNTIEKSEQMYYYILYIEQIAIPN